MGHRFLDFAPPVLHAASIVAQPAAEHNHAQIHAMARRLLQVRQQARPRPELPQFAQLAWRQVERIADRREQIDAVRRVSVAMMQQPFANLPIVQFLMNLVPLDLEGGHARHQVVDVADAGDEGRHRVAFGVVIVFASPRAGAHRLPAFDAVAFARKDILHLPHDHQVRIDDLLWQPQRRVDQRRNVEVVAVGQVV
jgi:hypothetical protein